MKARKSFFRKALQRDPNRLDGWANTSGVRVVTRPRARSLHFVHNNLLQLQAGPE